MSNGDTEQRANSTRSVYVGRVNAVIDYIEDSEIEDYLLERNARFRRMLERVKKEKGGMSLKEYRKSRGI